MSEPGAGGPPLGEAQFRRAVEDGLPTEPTDWATRFANGHREIAIPILTAAIKERLSDPHASWFVFKAADLAAGGANERSVEVLADVYQLDSKRFGRLMENVGKKHFMQSMMVWVDDALLSSLPTETREHMEKVVVRVRFEGK